MKAPQAGTRRVHYPSLTEAVERILRPLLLPSVALDSNEVPLEAAEVELLVAGRPSEAQLNALPRLSTLLIPFAGVPKSTAELLARYPDIAIHNLHHNAAPTAELAIALLLAAAKEVLPLDQKLRQGDWRPRYNLDSGILLEGKRAVVLWYGAIGQRVSRICGAMGMDVVAVRRTSKATEEEAGIRVVDVKALPELWEGTDFLLVCLPLTPATEGLVGSAELAAMPDHAVVVNVGRAQIIDEVALYDALAEKRIAAAGLDVWYRYPDSEEQRTQTLPANQPFHKLQNVVLSPHRAGHCELTETLRARELARSLNAFAEDSAVPYRVDLSRGY